MHAKYKVALALAAGFALGAGAILGLHAASPPAYVIGEIAVKDEDGYKKDFLPVAQKAIDDNGGKYIAGGFNKTFSITGQPPANRVVILQFENMDKVKAWRDVARDAQEKIGNKYATFRTFAVGGVVLTRKSGFQRLNPGQLGNCQVELKLFDERIPLWILRSLLFSSSLPGAPPFRGFDFAHLGIGWSAGGEPQAIKLLRYLSLGIV